MLRIGLSGGIGSGKSTVAGRLAEHGALVIDADRVAREVVEPGTDGLAEIAAEFGRDVIVDGALDRAALAARVFTDDDARKRLNAIVHPRVAARTAELIATAPADAVVVHDVPLLVENGLAPFYHLVIIVDAPVETRVERLVGRGLAEADARARIAAQADEAARRALADVWLDNSGTPDLVLAEVDALWADRIVRYEANVRLRRHTPRGAPRLVEYDPTWPAQAERVRARLAAATGCRVDHVGSTSVPGLAAKDILDFQVTADPATAEALETPLADAGFPHYPGLEDTPYPADDDPARWRKRTHVGADPDRWVNVHIRQEGMPNWRYGLLFPAWLRADAAARAEYEELKRTLAARAGTITEYGDAKTPWFEQAHGRAEAWARETGWTP
ncbi:dephospho-CoA kinase [Actinokineospora sp. UTMC 2448]|uniref:dephospho-CoA kinase n=1 Tax=Actinokineospora sp. UTMC 2448 TaxID=2268449 RepID=UPI0021641BFD|nr:dephospho-CoA kinase [Actinokineospora sp. UTMC 2448]UVS80316.1 Dephospho-CoA kinase [Actinokineospora sp. UTMC 2448]